MQTKNILITGANGQLGNEMRNILADDKTLNAYFTDVQELDITDEDAVSSYFNAHPIDYVVNCAAFTAVDKAESNKEFCAKLNVEAVEILARSASKHGAKMIQISTDYVFDGCGHKPYTENDEPNPQSVYGATKLDGEKALLKIAPDCVIVRTAWLYSPYGKNFVKTMLNLGRTKDALKVVVDQIGTPTYAGDLSKAIMAIIKNPEWKAGIYHFSDEGVISWYDFTKAIHRIAGITSCDVQPCNTTDYPTPATRPHYSVLDKTKIKATFGIKIPYWEDSLVECIKRLEDK
jgi:dTDP-4-dehydrorhamnose reductase